MFWAATFILNVQPFFIFFHSMFKFQYMVTSLRTLVCVFNLVRGLSSYFLPRMFEPSCCLQCVYNDLHIHMHRKPPTFSRSAHENASFFFFEEKTFLSGWRLGWDLGRWGLDIVSILM